MDPEAAAERMLGSWTASAATMTGTAGPDLGPAVLIALVADDRVADAALRAWLRTAARPGGGPALHGGLGTVLTGLRLLAGRRPAVARAADRAAGVLAAGDPARRTENVGFTDYDLVSGAAGVVLAHGTLGGPVPPAPVAYLAGLAADPALAGLRIGGHAGHPLVGWTQGTIVTGLAHGVAGPLAALSLVPDPPVAAVSHLAAWLTAHAQTDALGVTSWPHATGRAGPGPADPAGGPAVVRRQGWCYGTPGVAWALWTAGDVLRRAGLPGGAALCADAGAAMSSLCAAFDPAVHLTDDPLGICHGAAGILLVADAFARHAGLAEAAGLRDRLAADLRARMDEVLALDASLLAGAPGVLAALLTAAGGDRAWLRCLGLR